MTKEKRGHSLALTLELHRFLWT